MHNFLFQVTPTAFFRDGSESRNKLDSIVSNSRALIVNATNASHWKTVNNDLDYFEFVFREKIEIALKGPDPMQSTQSNSIFDVKSSTICIPKSKQA